MYVHGGGLGQNEEGGVWTGDGDATFQENWWRMTWPRYLDSSQSDNSQCEFQALVAAGLVEETEEGWLAYGRAVQTGEWPEGWDQVRRAVPQDMLCSRRRPLWEQLDPSGGLDCSSYSSSYTRRNCERLVAFRNGVRDQDTCAIGAAVELGLIPETVDGVQRLFWALREYRTRAFAGEQILPGVGDVVRACELEAPNIPEADQPSPLPELPAPSDPPAPWSPPTPDPEETGSGGVDRDDIPPRGTGGESGPGLPGDGGGGAIPGGAGGSGGGSLPPFPPDPPPPPEPPPPFPPGDPAAPSSSSGVWPLVLAGVALLVSRRR